MNRRITQRGRSPAEGNQQPPASSKDSRVYESEDLYRAGETKRLVNELANVESWDVDVESSVQLRMLWGMALFDIGEVLKAITVLEDAAELAHRTHPQLQFSTNFALFVRQSDFQTPDEVFQGLAQLRQLAARVGAGSSLSSLYLAVARLEGHRGLCAEAHQHLENARKFSSLNSDASIRCSLDLVEAGLESIVGNLCRSRTLAQHCYESARISGFVKYQVGSAATLAVLSLYGGQLRQARQFIDEALRRSPNLTYVQLGALDTLAQVELREGRPDKCRDLLANCARVIRKDRLPARSWYDLAHQQTHCTYHELREEWDAVIHIADEADGELARRQFRAVRTGLLGAKARALAHLGRHDEASRTLALAVRSCPRGAVDPLIILEASKAVCATLRGDSHLGTRFFNQALAACRSIGHRYHEWWIEHARTTVTPSGKVPVTDPSSERDVADTAILLGDVATILGAGHSIDLLAQRLIAILKSTTLGSRLDLQSESGLPYDPTPSSSWEATPEGAPDGTFRIRLRGSDRQVLISVRDVHSIDEISLLKAAADLVQAAVNRTADSNDEEQNLWPRSLMRIDGDTIFRSPRMIELLDIARRLAESSIPVLITGETGTGKEVFARLIHEHSKYRRGPFRAFSCPSGSKDLLESALFGHRRGAFTGAVDAQVGMVRDAEGGTLFFDEIGDLDPTVQPKLLRFLESGEYTPVGESRPIKANVRFVATTNRDLDHMVATGEFRSDLLYRIHGAKIALPALRERKDEIPALASLFVSRFARDIGRSGLRVGDDLIAALLLYDWPGNICQLYN